MTIERQGGQIVFRCDGDHCHEFIETDTGDFHTALILIKSSGWRPAKDEASGEWEHVCPECRET